MTSATFPSSTRGCALSVRDRFAPPPCVPLLLTRWFPAYSLVLMLASSVVYGWTVDKAVHLSVPLICQFGVGFASMTQFTSISTLLVDLFPHKSASATASNNLSRCLLGAGATAVIDPIIGAMGNGASSFRLLDHHPPRCAQLTRWRARTHAGWAFTMLSLITLASAPPARHRVAARPGDSAQEGGTARATRGCAGGEGERKGGEGACGERRKSLRAVNEPRRRRILRFKGADGDQEQLQNEGGQRLQRTQSVGKYLNSRCSSAGVIPLFLLPGCG